MAVEQRLDLDGIEVPARRIGVAPQVPRRDRAGHPLRIAAPLSRFAPGIAPSRGCLGSRRIATLTHLRREIRAWMTHANRAGTRIRWRFTRKEARRKFGYQTNLSKRSKT